MIFPAVSPVSLRISDVLASVQLNSDPGISAKQIDFQPPLFVERQQERPQSSGERRRDGLIEEDPDMTASPGARSLEGRRKVEPPASREKGEHILLPAGFVEVDREEVARLIQQQRNEPSRPVTPPAAVPSTY